MTENTENEYTKINEGLNNTVITDKGRSLMAKIVAGTATPQFTKIRTSDYQYPTATNFESLTSMNNVKQEVDVSSVVKLDAATVKVSGVITNIGLESGYYVRNIGLYALDPTEGEILYSITSAIEADWMPPTDGKAISSIMVDINTTVSNSYNVSLEVNLNAATVQMVNDVKAELTDVKDFVGYTEGEGKRFLIGTTQAGWEAKDVDYLCTGTNDQVQINNALNDLPEGGEVVILDGIYNIEEAIHIAKDNTTLRGNGNATVLKRMYNSVTDTGNKAKGLITLDNKKGCKIKNLHIDGNKDNYSSSNNYGIRLDSSSSDNTITGNICNNNSGYGIYLRSSSSNTITDNTCGNNDYGIYLYSSSDNNTITGNICNNNDYRGIHLTSSSSNTITDNTCNNNSGYGIYLYHSSSINNTVTGNTCNNNKYGICLDHSSSNTLTDNTCNNNSGYGIYLYPSSNNTITSNICSNNKYGIYIYAPSSNNAITGNICNNNNNYGIRLSSSSSCKYNCIVGNILVDNGTAYSGGGTENIEASNVKK